MRHGYRVERLGQSAYLVDLYQYRIAAPLLYAAAQIAGVGNEQIVADQLASAADTLCEHAPALPVVLRHAVFDRVDRIAADELFEIVYLLL